MIGGWYGMVGGWYGMASDVMVCDGISWQSMVKGGIR